MGLNELLLWLLTEKAGFHYLISRSVTAVIGYCWKFVLRKVILFP
jgi:putative flippase GtrA